MKFAMQNCMTEFSLISGKRYRDPFNEIQLDAVFTTPDGMERVVPAFWAGENVWRIRYSSPVIGRHSYRMICSDAANSDLHRQEGVVEIAPYTGANPLLQHGPLRVSEDRRHLEHLDGTPFFWLGDTWWFGLAKRLIWPGDFQLLTADRVAKGFSLIQIVAGLYPDIYEFDERGANEAGVCWEEGYSRINPAYFDMADLRIDWLVRSGLVPCIVAAWGYYIRFMGVDGMKKHWRNLVARYGAYPVVWCVAGEAVMTFYGENWGDAYKAEARAGWTAVTRYLRELDPYHHPITIHPTRPDSREMLDDESLLDVDMLQTGHSYTAAEGTVRAVSECVAKTPRMPVVNGEVMYEGIMGACWQDMQRFCFWTSLLSGSAGHTYGANGIWQMATPEEPCVAISGSWGDVYWQDACKLPGSGQMGIGRRLLERYPWWEFEPRYEPDWNEEERISPFVAGIPGKVWVMYLATDSIEGKYRGFAGKSFRIEPKTHYRAYFFNPRTGKDVEVGDVRPDPEGWWKIPAKPSREDWVLVLEGREE